MLRHAGPNHCHRRRTPPVRRLGQVEVAQHTDQCGDDPAPASGTDFDQRVRHRPIVKNLQGFVDRIRPVRLTEVENRHEQGVLQRWPVARGYMVPGRWTWLTRTTSPFSPGSMSGWRWRTDEPPAVLPRTCGSATAARRTGQHTAGVGVRPHRSERHGQAHVRRRRAVLAGGRAVPYGRVRVTTRCATLIRRANDVLFVNGGRKRAASGEEAARSRRPVAVAPS